VFHIETDWLIFLQEKIHENTSKFKFKRNTGKRKTNFKKEFPPYL